MRYLIIIVLLSFLTSRASGQNLDETVNYINNILKVNHDWLGSSSGVFGSDYKLAENPSYQITKISVDFRGKIEVIIYQIDSITTKILSSGPPCYSYLKGLDIFKGENYLNSDDNKSLYKITLKCVPSSHSSFICNDGTVDRLSFLINNSDARDRLFNAFSHLLELVKGNKDFYNKDPFSN